MEQVSRTNHEEWTSQEGPADPQLGAGGQDLHQADNGAAALNESPGALQSDPLDGYEPVDQAGPIERMDQPPLHPDAEIPQGDPLEGWNGNIEDLSPDVQPLARSLQSHYQKGFQQNAAASKETDMLAQKAAAFDQLITDPNKRSEFMSGFGDTSASGPQSHGMWHDDDLESVDAKSQFDDPTYQGVEAMIYKAFKSRLEPELQRLNALSNYSAQQTMKNQWDSLVSQYPSASQHANAVAAKMQASPNLSLQEALFAVAGPSLLQAAHTTPPKGRSNGTQQRQGIQYRADAGSRRPASKAAPSLEAIIASSRKQLGIQEGMF